MKLNTIKIAKNVFNSFKIKEFLIQIQSSKMRLIRNKTLAIILQNPVETIKNRTRIPFSNSFRRLAHQ